MPEAQRALERAIFVSSEEIDKHRQKIASAGESAEKEVKNNQPTPVRRRAKKGAGGNRIHGRSSPSSVPVPRLRKLMTPIRPTRTAPRTENHELDARLRVGILGSGGKP